MKLIRFGDPGRERPGVILPDGTGRDASAVADDWNESFFASDGIERLRRWIGSAAASAPVLKDGVRLGPPVARPSKIVCVGLNYRDHAAESGQAVPAEPVLFMKSSTALSGPFDPILIPPESTKLDWEVELAFVIGRRSAHVSERSASEHVAGYTVMNDVSERAFQIERGGQWVKGKSSDSFAPLGPWLVTPDEIPDPHALALSLKVNGQTVQNSTTSQMIFGVPQLVSYISRFMTLLPGDIVSTGTPSGVGLGFKPPRYLKIGDIVEPSVHGLGTQRQTVAPWDSRGG
jgi:2-keto-4-pentenoate hydratase/2-oxohepta-3-ene-1,7-dioic acid hydratase in catechol pathway